MIDNNHILTNQDRAVLVSCIGKTIKRIEGRDFSDFYGKSHPMLNGIARLIFSDSSVVELHCDYVEVSIAGDFWDDTGAFSVKEESSDIWLPDGESPVTIPIRKAIRGIALLNDYDKLSERDRLVSTFAFTNAVALNLGDEHLVFSMDYFDEDTININRGPELEALLPENMGSWYEKDGWNDEFRRELVTIG